MAAQGDGYAICQDFREDKKGSKYPQGAVCISMESHLNPVLFGRPRA